MTKKIGSFLCIFALGASFLLFQNFTPAEMNAAAAAAAPKIISCAQGKGQLLEISGSNKLEKGCNYYGGFSITTSNTTLDCQGSTLWGVAPAARASLPALTGKEFADAIEAKTISAVSRGIYIASSQAAIKNIEVKNCNIRAFKQAIRIQNESSGSKWLWKFAAKDSVLKGPYAKYVATVNANTKENLLNALLKYPWEASSLPDSIRAVTPRDVRVTNVVVDLTSKTGVYLDHHVTGVQIKNMKVQRAAGPGIYLEFGSRNNSILDSTFLNNGREGIAIDSSAKNVVQGSTFSGNVNGGIYLYRNCWEFFDDPGVIDSSSERGNYFPRTQGSDDNNIINNKFYGFAPNNGRSIGVWVASRQSRPANFEGHGCGLYKMAAAPEGTFYHEDRAKNVKIIGNLFSDLTNGAIIEDDGARFMGNRIESSVLSPIQFGTQIRAKALGLPVVNGRIAFNQIYQTAGKTAIESVIAVADNPTKVPYDLYMCSNYGRPDREVVTFGALCTKEYYGILKQGWFADSFQGVVNSRIEDYGLR